MNVCLLGATGTIGRATLAALTSRGHHVTCIVRRAPLGGSGLDAVETAVADVTDAAAIRDVFRSRSFDAVVSCMASRTGAPADAWAIDYRAHSTVLTAAKTANVGRFVLVSAICVQKPRLAFQHAKLAFEAELAASGLTYAIVRPTAFFKSLSGQVERVRQGKPYLLFGDGRLTACKPVSDGDIAAYLGDCLTDPERWNRILPVGGPGPAQTPREQGETLFELAGKAPRFRRVPVGLMDAIIGGLSIAGRLSPRATAKAELARIGRYYATESMLLWDATAGRYDADATPETGSERLTDYWRALLSGAATLDRGDHAVF
jgi:divinyl chlorophyllide a 8-vinyl-reductase